MKIKIIDLLNMISKGEEVPKKIKVHDTEYYKCILKTGIDYKIYSDDFYYLSNDICKAGFSLNDEVEILEEEEKKIPENINKNYKIRIFNSGKPHKINYDMEKLIEMVQDIFSKQKEIIDYLQSKGE